MFEGKKAGLSPRVARKIKELRKARNITQKELAELAGVTESAMRSYELSDRNPKPEVLDRIARALKVRPEYLSAPEFKGHLEFAYALLENDEDEGYTVTMVNGQPAIVPDMRTAGIGFDRFLRDWNKMKEKLDTGEIAPEKYREWKRTYEDGSSWINTPDGKDP